MRKGPESPESLFTKRKFGEFYTVKHLIFASTLLIREFRENLVHTNFQQFSLASLIMLRFSNRKKFWKAQNVLYSRKLSARELLES